MDDWCDDWYVNGLCALLLEEVDVQLEMMAPRIDVVDLGGDSTPLYIGGRASEGRRGRIFGF